MPVNQMKGGVNVQTDIAVALIALLGSAIGTFGGILTGSKLTGYRIQQLEKKVEKHNGVMERTLILEEQCKAVRQRLEDHLGHSE
ncbi:MAG: hypothetical protein PUC05_07115 [Firmicutes bacterium]|nr:hypothetical protein [Bacillota bacterium]